MISLNLNEIFRFYRRKEIWVILFYKWSDEESKRLKDEYRTLAEKMYGIIKVGAVDCQEEEELCEEFAAYQIPTIKVFQEAYSDDGERYTGKNEWKAISNFATQKMQSFVSLVNTENFQQFIDRDPAKYKVLLFTERKTTAPIFKALSKQFKDKLLFGEVRKSSQSELITKFGVTQFPTMLVITDPFTFESEKYADELKIDRLTKFLNQYSYKAASYEKKLDFTQLTAAAYRQQSLCGKRTSNICFIFFTSSSV